MSASDLRLRSVLLRACMLAALAVSSFASAQAPSNPTLNAQLLVGARQGDLAQVQRVLEAGASPASRNRLGKTALLLAAEKGNLAIVEAVLQKGADVNRIQPEGTLEQDKRLLIALTGREHVCEA